MYLVVVVVITLPVILFNFVSFHSCPPLFLICITWVLSISHPLSPCLICGPHIPNLSFPGLIYTPSLHPFLCLSAFISFLPPSLSLPYFVFLSFPSSFSLCLICINLFHPSLSLPYFVFLSFPSSFPLCLTCIHLVPPSLSLPTWPCPREIAESFFEKRISSANL